jgi:hypothetical protein
MTLERDVSIAGAYGSLQIQFPRHERMPAIGTNDTFRGKVSSALRQDVTGRGNFTSGFRFENVHATKPCIIKQARIEQTAPDCDHFQTTAINVNRQAARRREPRAAHRSLRTGAHGSRDAEFLEHRPATRVDDIAADFVAWKFFVFDQRDGETALRAECRRRRARGAASDHDNVELIHNDRVRDWR